MSSQSLLMEEVRDDRRLTERCATDGCGGQVTQRVEYEGIGAYHCSGCAAKIERNFKRHL